MTVRVTQDYVETLNPKGFLSNRDITNIDGNYLVRPSQNVRIKNGEKVVSSERYTLLGAAKTVSSGIVSSFDWKTNTKDYRNLKAYRSGSLGILKCWYKDVWETVANNLDTPNLSWAPWWSSDEQIDFLLGVNGTHKMFMWSGGIAEVASVTSNTITKKKYLSGTTYAFNNNGASPDTITDSASGFVTAGFEVDDIISVSGSTLNDGNYTIKTVTAGTITLIDTDSLDTEASGAAIVIKDKNTGTWGQSRFLASVSGRAVRIGNRTYTYSGGEGTGTLTGVSPSPVADGVVAGDLAVQALKEYTPTEMAGGEYDLIGVLDNHVYIGSTRSRELLVSAVNDFVDFTPTTPVRVPGEGFDLTLDASPVGFVPEEGKMFITAGDDDWYKITLTLTSDGTGESVNVEKLKTSPGQAAVSQSAIARIKNGVAFLSVEKTIDTLANIENFSVEQSVPISDDISDEFDEFSIEGADMKYHKRSLFVLLPAVGRLYEYDMRYGWWNPPQLIPCSKLAIIGGRLCGHSSNSDETYTLFEGYNDNGAPFKAIAAFGYENSGARFSLKKFTEAPVEIKISRSTVVIDRIIYEYKGARGIKEFRIDSTDPRTVFEQADTASLGKEKLGSNPLGSSEQPDELVKVRLAHLTQALDYFERQRLFESESPDCRFEILAFGENTQLSENEPTFIRK